MSLGKAHKESANKIDSESGDTLEALQQIHSQIQTLLATAPPKLELDLPNIMCCQFSQGCLLIISWSIVTPAHC